MESKQEIQETPQNEAVYEENPQEEYVATEESTVQEEANQKNRKTNNASEDRSGFIHGLAVGLGIGCIATFVIVWISIFFTPQLPTAVTYENLLSIFVYPLVYLLAVGLIALTAGVVREYYAIRHRL